MKTDRTLFGHLQDGKAVERITVSNSTGLTASWITLGGTLSSLEFPDRNGDITTLVCGFDSLADYEAGHPFFGVLVGRFANRIGNARFTVDGKTYELSKNDVYGVPAGQEPRHHLHGGFQGFDKKVWNAKLFEQERSAGVIFSYLSKDGEEGYPGNLDVEIICSLSEDNELAFNYKATTDAATPVNLTNHAYWNLAGAGSGSVANHLLTLHCPRYVVVDAELIPTGEIRDVENTPMDFRKSKRIGDDLARVPGGYDHCFVCENLSDRMKDLATLVEPSSGRAMDIRTTKPAVQFYSGNFLDGTIRGAGGHVYEKHGALCLETEFFPDSVNHPEFPSPLLLPGETYKHETVHRFYVV